MTVITLSSCPPKLRGDLTKWMIEINTGVYVGRVNARVRDQLWERVCANIQDGRATMVFNARNEQHMEFKSHNSKWETVDFDGIKLVCKPYENKKDIPKPVEKTVPQKAKAPISSSLTIPSDRQVKQCLTQPDDYVVVDIETTGLKPEEAEIIQIAAIRYLDNFPEEEFCRYIHLAKPIPEFIVNLTGITDDKLLKEGEEEEQVLKDFLSFIGDATLVGHNVGFDIGFIDYALRKYNLKLKCNAVDTWSLAKQKITRVKNYKLTTLAEHFGIRMNENHDALSDCRVTHELLLKLNES